MTKKIKPVSGRGGVFYFDHRLGKIVEGRAPKRRGVAQWPIHSDAMGVAPSQRQQLADFLASKGVPTEVDGDGNPVLTGPRHRKQVAEARAFYDRNGGYSDPQRESCDAPVDLVAEFFE